MRKIVHVGAFTASTRDIINQNFARLGITPGRVMYLDPINGYDASADYDNPDKPFRTLAGAYAALRSGKHDAIAHVSDGTSSATARNDAAFTWAKNAAHYMGICPPLRRSQRARIAPTATTTAFANFFTITGTSCAFQNVQFWHGFNTGVAASIAVTISGTSQRNYFENVHFAGMGDDASAQDADSRCLKITGTGGENEFINCAFGVDTVARTAANALVEFAGGTPRNRFKGCSFDCWTTTAQTQLDILVAAAAAIDRIQEFDDCVFTNSMKSSGYLIQTAIGSIAAGQNGMILFRNCTLSGRTGYGKDATTRGFMLIDGPAPNNGTGIAVAPNA